MWLHSAYQYVSDSELTRKKQKTEFQQNTRTLEMKIQIQFRKHESKCYQPKQRREENCIGKYSRGLRNQNAEHLVNIYESNILETQVNYTELYVLLKVQMT